MSATTSPAPEFPVHPIFDALLAESDFTMFPLEEFRSHEQFMRDSGQPEFLSHAEAVLRGEVQIKPASAQVPAPRTTAVAKKTPAPVKRNR